jgi:hypothetical protein
MNHMCSAKLKVDTVVTKNQGDWKAVYRCILFWDCGDRRLFAF